MKTLQRIGISILLVFAATQLGYAKSDERDIDREHARLDSLLSIYYLQKQLGEGIAPMEVEVELDLPTIADLPDSIYIERLSKIISPVHLPYNDKIRSCIIAYTQRHKQKSEIILGLAEYYMPIFEEILDQHGVPLELKTMAVIESALNPQAVSRVGATGMWQFMYRTGKHYNLNVTSFVDDRRDPVASAHAAAKYLKDLYTVFDDWTLAIAAYNCGEGNVSKAIRRAGGKRDYWAIYPYLPRETRGYVPLFIGATYMLHYYKEHGLNPVNAEKPIQTDTVMVNQMLHFEQIAEVINLPVQLLRDLNPQYKKDIIPGKEMPYVLTLPYNFTSDFVSKEEEIYSYNDSIYFNPKTLATIANAASDIPAGGGTVIYKVQKGDTPGGIAKRYGVSLNNLKAWNNLGTNSIIRIGQKLTIHTKKKG